MNDVTWVTIEKAEELFFVSKAEIDTLIETGELDHKIQDFDGRSVKLLMLHQLARHFDGRDTRARMTSDDLKDVVKGAASNIMYVAAGAVLVSAKDLFFGSKTDKEPLEEVTSDEEINRRLYALFDSQSRHHQAGAKYALEGIRPFLAELGISGLHFARSANVARSRISDFLAGSPLGWPTFIRCVQTLTAICLSRKISIVAVSIEPQGDPTLPILLGVLEVSDVERPKPSQLRYLTIKQFTA